MSKCPSLTCDGVHEGHRSSNRNDDRSGIVVNGDEKRRVEHLIDEGTMENSHVTRVQQRLQTGHVAAVIAADDSRVPLHTAAIR